MNKWMFTCANEQMEIRQAYREVKYFMEINVWYAREKREFLYSTSFP